MMNPQKNRTHMKEDKIMMMTYLTENGWNLPNLTPPQEIPVTGKYALMRERYLIEHQRSLYLTLLTSGTLNQHLMEVQRQAEEMLEQAMKKMPLPEQMKQENPMEWTGRMNNQKHSIEETIYQTLIIS